jgi:hypothetical protein
VRATVTWQGGFVRVGSAILVAVNLWWGSWAVLAPRQFFDTFPGFGHHWTAAYPPYNQHLVTDLGSTFLTLAFLLAVAAIGNDRRVRTAVLTGVLVFNALHLGFHVGHHEGMAALDVWASLAALAAGVLAPIVLLLVDRITPRRTHSPPGPPA